MRERSNFSPFLFGNLKNLPYLCSTIKNIKTMKKHLLATKHFKKEIDTMRNAIHENLIQLMESYNKDVVDCYESDDCPIVISGVEDDCMTLDSINLHNVNGKKFIVFDCSGSWNNTSVCISQIDIEILIDIHDWVFDNEVLLFEDVE